MSSSVESRILTMKIESSTFQRGVGTILSSLSTLQRAIAGLKPTTAFSDISKGAAKTDMTPLATQIDGINAKFLAMATVGVTAISNLVNRAVDAGFSLANSLTLGPISSGLDEYETNLNSIQTILANTDGENLRDVNNALDQLNHYSDKTIYNFSEMARNIGMFTAAGVDLDTSVGAIKGIANLAAVSGSNSQQASTAMYQLSQALSTGTVKLMDWNSVVNAGMGGKVFQDALKTTARVQGVAIDDIIEKNGSFRDSLQEGWLTADILNETLMQFAGELNKKQLENRGYSEQQIADIIKMGNEATDAATKVKTMSQLINTLQETVGSGWAMTWRLIFGDFNQAKEMWTAANNEIGGILSAMAKRRNEMLRDWQKEGGRDAALEAINNAWHAILRVLGPVARAWRDVFPRMTGKQLADITKAIQDFTEHLILSRPVMHDIRNTFKGLFDILDIGVEIVKGIVRWFVTGLALILGGLSPTAAGVLDLTGGLGKMLDSLHDFLVEGGKISGFFDAIIAGREKAFGPLLHIIGVLLGAAIRLLARPLYWFLDTMDAISPYVDVVDKLVSSFENLVDIGLNKAFEWVAGFSDEFEAMGNAISDFVGRYVGKLVDFLDSMRPYADDVGEIANQFGEWAKSKAAVVAGKIADAFERLLPILKEIGGKIQDVFGSIAGAAGGVGSGIASAIGGSIGSIDLGGIFDFGDAGEIASNQIGNVKDALGDTDGVVETAKAAWNGFLGVMQSVWDFLQPIADKAKEIFAPIGEQFAESLGKADDVAGVAKAAWDGLGNAISAVGDFLKPVPGMIADMFRGLGTLIHDIIDNLGTEDMFAAINTAFLAFFSVSMAKFFGNLGGVMKSAKDMFNQGGGVLSQLTDNLKTMQQSVKADMILTIAIAVGVLAASLFVLATIPAGKLAFSLGMVIIMITALVTAMKLLMKDKDLLDPKKTAALALMSVAMLGLSVAILAMSAAIAILGHMDMKTITKGLFAVAMIMAVMAGAAALLNYTGGAAAMLAAAAAILVLSVALSMFAATLKLYSKLDFGMIAEGLAKTAFAIVVLGLALTALSGGLVGAIALGVMAVSLAILVPVLYAMSKLDFKTMAIVVGALALSLLILGGVGAVIGLPLLVLGVAVTALGAGLFLAGAGLALFGAGLATLVALGAGAAAVLTATVVSIADLLPYIFKKFGEAMGVLAKEIVKQGPKLGIALQVALEAISKAITKALPEMGRMMRELAEQMLKTLRSYIPDLIALGIDMLIALLKGIRANITQITNLAIDILIKFLKALGSRARELANQGADTVIKFIDGVANSITTHKQELSDAAGRLGQAIIDGLITALGNGLSAVRDKAEEIAQGALHAAIDIIKPGSESKVFAELGETIPAGLVKGMDSGADNVDQAGRRMGERTQRAFRDVLDLLGGALGSEFDLSPTITPVLDLSEVRRNAGAISKLLDGNRDIASVSYEQAAAIFAERQAADEEGKDEGRRYGDIKIEQTNISPKPLDDVRIYRNTRSLVPILEEALKS